MVINPQFHIKNITWLLKPIIFLVTIFLLTGTGAGAQELHGYWKGKLTMAPGGCFPVYHIEFQLQIIDNKVTGNSYHYSDTTNYVQVNFEGSYDSVNKIVHIQEKGIIKQKIPADCEACVKAYTLTVHQNNAEIQLRGNWTGHLLNKATQCPSGNLVLTRSKNSDFKPDIAPTLLERKTIVENQIFVDTGTIHLRFYDNGQIDGDTISVYTNNQLLLGNQMLKTEALRTEIRITPQNPDQVIVMVGENLGTIPPNTALMIIEVNQQQHRIFLSSNEKKNAAVRITWKDLQKRQ